MPVTYQIDEKLALIRTRCTGDVRFLEVVNHFRDLEREPDLPARLDVLLDLTDLESVPESDPLSSVTQPDEAERWLASLRPAGDRLG